MSLIRPSHPLSQRDYELSLQITVIYRKNVDCKVGRVFLLIKKDLEATLYEQLIQEWLNRGRFVVHTSIMYLFISNTFRPPLDKLTVLYLNV